jgi:hypothetical protein
MTTPASPKATVLSRRRSAPLVEQPDHGQEQEHRHGGEARPAELAKDDRPRVHEDDLDVENDEQDGGEVELDREATPGRPARLVAALEGLQLGGGAIARAEQAAGVDHHQHDHQRQGEGDQHGDVLGEHRAACLEGVGEVLGGQSDPARPLMKTGMVCQPAVRGPVVL